MQIVLNAGRGFSGGLTVSSLKLVLFFRNPIQAIRSERAFIGVDIGYCLFTARAPNVLFYPRDFRLRLVNGH